MKTLSPETFLFSRDELKQVERIDTPDGNAIAIIAKRRDSTFTAFVYIWDLSELEYIGKGYWAEYESGSIFDSIETARSNALENLQCKSGKKPT